MVCRFGPAKGFRLLVMSGDEGSDRVLQVERWFALLTQRQIKRGSHRSVQELLSSPNLRKTGQRQ